MFPLRDANPRHRFPIVMWLFILINAAVFYYEFSLFNNEAQLERFVLNYGFIPAEFFALPVAEFFTLITSLFLHGGLAHLLGNMFFLGVFGDNIEDRMGPFRFILFYLLGGIVATLVHGLFGSSSSLPLVGASGAVSAIMGAYIVLFPRQKILTLIAPLFLPWLIVRLFRKVGRFFLPWLPAWLYIAYWALLQVIEATTGLVTPEADMTNVAWWAHIGGFLFGLITIRLFVKPASMVDSPVIPNDF